MEKNRTVLELQTENETKTQPKKLPSTCFRCGNKFDKPIFAVRNSQGVSEGYYACPRCLSKIESQKEENIEEVAETTTENTKTTHPKKVIVIEPTPTVCPHYSGYLKKRPKETPVPEECFTCPEMLDCMSK